MRWCDVVEAIPAPHEGWGVATSPRPAVAVGLDAWGDALRSAGDAARALSASLGEALITPMRGAADALTPRGGRLSARPPHEQRLPSATSVRGTSTTFVVHDELQHWHAPRARGWGKGTMGGARPPGYPLEKVPAGAGGPGPSPAERPRV